MLAYPVSDKPIDYTKPVFIQPKLDGVRCLIQYDAGKVTAYSRTGKVWKNIEHIELNLLKFFNKYPNVILDGELYNHAFKHDFESIISMVRKQKPTMQDRLKSAENVQFHCYDIVDEKLPFQQRIEFINKNLILSNSIRIVETYRTEDDHYSKLTHGINKANGYEGSILRSNNK